MLAGGIGVALKDVPSRNRLVKFACTKGRRRASLLDLADALAGVEVFGAHLGAVHDLVAPA